MKPEKSGTAPICSGLASGYCHDPAAVLNSSITVPTMWKIRMTTASFGVSSRKRSIERSEEHTSELQSLMRISYAVFCLKKKTHSSTTHPHPDHSHSTSPLHKSPTSHR